MFNLIKFFSYLLRNPLKIVALLFIKTFPKKIIQKKIFYSNLIKEKTFLLSFDCDTQEDINILESLLKKLSSIQIKIVLAIPAELINNNLDKIKILNKNFKIEFLNHGYYLHTEYDNKTSSTNPIFSYEKKSLEFIRNDILKAHEYFKNKFGIELVGFRAPHFGEISFKKKKNIFKYLKSLNYKFSTSSIYDLAIIKGAVFNYNGITEMTVTGCVDNQNKMLDSWSYLEKVEDKVILSDNYIDELKKLINFYKSEEYNYINIYADPSHIINKDEFFYYIKNFSNFNKFNFKEITDLK